MNFEALRRRRATYQRSQTLGSLPLHLIQQQQPPSDRKHSREAAEGNRIIVEGLNLLTPIADSPVHYSEDTLRPLAVDMTLGGFGSPSGDGPQLFRPSTSPRRRHSPSDFAHTHVQEHDKRANFDHSRSISAVLFTKVKDRIVEKMFQTATEGPHLAAIVQERRQRAADEYEARRHGGASKAYRKELQVGAGGSLQVEERPTFTGISGISGRRMRTSLGSSPIKEMPIKEEGESETHERIRMAKAAFRRRSVSQDAAEMGMLLQQPRVGQGKARTGSQVLAATGGGSLNVTPSSGSQNFDGIICSNDDFQAIVMMGQHMQGVGGGEPNQKPRLSSRAQSFNHGPFQTTKQSSNDQQQHQQQQARRSASNCNVEGEVETSMDCRQLEKFSNISSEQISVVLHPPSSISAKKPCLEVERSKPPTTIQPISIQNLSESSGTVGDENDLDKDKDCPKLAAVPDIEFDENGQTWDVYGAEFDPEILGDAIQLHLKRLIERKLLEMQQPTSEKDNQLAKDLMTTGRRNTRNNEECKHQDRKRSFRAETKRTANGEGGTRSIFRYLCIFAKRRHSSNDSL